METLASKYKVVRYAVKFGLPIAALIASWYWLPIISDGLRNSSWPVLPATVASSQIRLSPEPEPRSVADVVYTYAVGSQNFRTNRYDLFGLLGGTGMGQQESASQFVAAHPPGSQITIRCCPSHPELSVIQSGLDSRHAVLVFALCLLYMFSYLGLRYGLRRDINRGDPT